MIKQESQASIRETADEEDYSELSEEVKNVKYPKEAISIIKGENRKMINIVGKQGKILKKLLE